MKKTLFSMLAAAVLLGTTGFKPSPDEYGRYQDPVAVVSLASFDQLMDSVKLAGRLAGRPQLADGFQGIVAVLTQGRGLAGLDPNRPWGIVVTEHGPQPGGYVFLPVDDIEKLKEVFQPYLARMEDVGDGVLKLKGRGQSQTVFAKHKESGWLFVCNQQEGLASAPDDPRPLLGDLPDRYDVAVRVNASRLPARQRDELIGKIQQRAKGDLQRRLGEDENEYAARKIVGTQLVRAVVALVEDTEEVTVGWNLADDADHVSLELEMTASEDSTSAQKLKQWSTAKTRFRGFCPPDALVASNFVATCDFGTDAPLDALLAAVRAKAFEDIDLGDASADQARSAKKAVDDLLDVVQETIEGGRIDEATSLVLSPNAATLLAARHVADGAKVDGALDQLVEAIRQEYPDVVDQSLVRDVDKCRGVQLHTLALPIPDDAENRDTLVQLIGQRLQIVVGIGEQSIYLSAGRDAMQALKQAIETSVREGEVAGPPVEISLALSHAVRFVAEFGNESQKRRSQNALRSLEGRLADRDHIRLAVRPSERGIKLSLELEEGTLDMVPAMRQAR